MVSVDVKLRAQELCESRGGRPGLPVPNSPYGLCGRKATVNLSSAALAPGTHACRKGLELQRGPAGQSDSLEPAVNTIKGSSETPLES